MKKALKNVSFIMILATIFSVSLFMTSCTEDEIIEGNKTTLNTLITECETLVASAIEGTAPGFYEVGSKAVFQVAIDAAKTVSTDVEADQTATDAAKVNLDAAKTVFEGKMIQDVSTDGLVGQWMFNGDASDNTGNGFDGTPTIGHEFWGAGTPALTADRFGNEDNAYYFDKGANIDIPYSSALNPSVISLSWWVYMEELPNNDYMISMSRWDCYKVNFQEANRVFFTTKIIDPADPEAFIYNNRDHDGEGLTAETWYHLAVSYGNAHMKFYINGELVKDWTDVPDVSINNISGAPVDLVFGQDLPTAIYSTDDQSPYYVNWGGYFKGKLDDIRLYNRVLADNEVSSIYNVEKPQ